MADSAASGPGVTVGLIPRHLRRQADASEAERPDEPADERFAEDDEASSEQHETSLTDDLRRRITQVSAPERKGRKPIWIGLAVVVVLALAGLIFATGLASLFPDLDTSR